MPTPVPSARQCLSGDAAAALDEAVTVARRRCHAQTTSLHVVSALLSLPSSSSTLLRDALSRARPPSYSPRLQFKALELCFSVALDRLPSASGAAGGSDPPVSNSLMAAIKRSQANQRRNPETFQMYNSHVPPQPASFAGVKVELQQLVVAILDDPVVSRVFGEAGFRSCDIKFAVLRPPPPAILRFPRPARCPPLFLCNFSRNSGGEDFDSGGCKGFSFPFSRKGLGFYSDVSEENCRRIGEVLVRKKGRNPLLVGAGAVEAGKDVAGAMGRERWGLLPPEVAGVRFFDLEEDVGREREWIEGRLGELVRLLGVERGVLVGVGDLKGFLDDDGCGGGRDKEGLEYLVSELSRMVGVHAGRLWLIGSSASYEIYMKFLACYPSVDKGWDLQLLPITSVKVGSPGLSPKPNSLTESFVPFGGFFPMPSNPIMSSSRSSQSAPRCNHCNENYEQELTAVVKEHSVLAADLQNPGLPSWLQKSPVGLGNLDVTKARDDSAVLNGKITDLQKKWNGICETHRNGSNVLETGPHGSGREVFPRIVGFPHVVRSSNTSQANIIVHSNQEQCGSGNTHPSTGSLEKDSAKQSLSTPVLTSPDEKELPELELRLSKSELLRTDSVSVPSHSGGVSDDHTSHTTMASVSTDLMLGTIPASSPKLVRPTPHVGDLPRCFSFKNSDVASESVSTAPIRSSLGLVRPDHPLETTKLPVLQASHCKVREDAQSVLGSPKMSSQFNVREFKTLYKSLLEKVGRQQEAICAISEAITRCKAGHGRQGVAGVKGDIWLSFVGPDRIGKKRVAIALAELLYDCKEKLICVDLGSQEGGWSPYVISEGNDVAGCDENLRGKTVIDRIASEISKMPWSIVFLENVEKADFLVQSTLSEAIRTGRFSDSHRREINISNTVFILAASEVKKRTLPTEQSKTFSEERILAAKKLQMKITVESALKPMTVSPTTSRKESEAYQHASSSTFVNKRKLSNSNDAEKQSKSQDSAKRSHKSLNTFLDLNISLDDTVVNDVESSSHESNSASSDGTSAWLEDFFSHLDETVVFKPFDFDTLARNILKDITENFQNTVKSKCRLEIDPKVMEQVLAATWLLEDKEALTGWMKTVLTRCFVEARERYNLSSHTVLHLVACEDDLMIEHSPGILLPSVITLN